MGNKITEVNKNGEVEKAMDQDEIKDQVSTATGGTSQAEEAFYAEHQKEHGPDALPKDKFLEHIRKPENRSLLIPYERNRQLGK